MAEAVSADIFAELNTSKIRSDDTLLDDMRLIIKEYVDACLAGGIDPQEANSLKDRFNQTREQLNNSVLRDYSSFEFMETLYKQECLLRD